MKSLKTPKKTATFVPKRWFISLPGCARKPVDEYMERAELKSMKMQGLLYELILDGIKYRDEKLK
jgi:hypothetical protein